MSETDLNSQAGGDDSAEFVTIIIADQLFGLPIERVEDVFALQSLTHVPLSKPEISGVLNLRGRIVTAIDIRVVLGVEPSQDISQPMAVGVEYKGESYGLIIDKVGEVLRLDKNAAVQEPSNLDPRWRAIAGGVYQLENDLMVVFDVDQVLENLMQSDAA